MSDWPLFTTGATTASGKVGDDATPSPEPPDLLNQSATQSNQSATSSNQPATPSDEWVAADPSTASIYHRPDVSPICHGHGNFQDDFL